MESLSIDHIEELVIRTRQWNYINYSFNSHTNVQLNLKKLFEDIGFIVKIEFPVLTKKFGRLDLMMFHPELNMRVPLEIDKASPRYKSVEKIESVKPDLGIVVLRTEIWTLEKKQETMRKIQHVNFPLLVVNLPTGETQLINSPIN